jgi:hypothetical protein
MSMVCPQCNGSFEQRLQCPTCNVRLLYQATRRPGVSGVVGSTGGWQHTPWGRIVIGLLLAQGLYHGLQQLCTAGLLAVAEDSSRDVWTTLFGLILQQGLQGIGLLAGGMLAGAGQRRGFLLGAVVGVWHALILTVIAQFSARTGTTTPYGQALTVTTLTASGQFLLLTVFGAAGGLIGSLIWKPLPTVSLPSDQAKGALKLSGKGKRSLLGGRVAWLRVLLGVAIVVAGALSANAILKFLLEAAGGKLTIRSHLQARLVNLEICGLAVVLGGCLAGATTSNGLKQGLCVGLGASAILIGLHVRNPVLSTNELIYRVVSTSALALTGGWFGGQLFPPVLSSRRKVSPIGSV